MNGVDVSRWQPANVLDLIDFDFAVVKITQGNSLSNANIDKQLAKAKDKGVYGVYHFDNGNDNYKGEVDAFVKESKSRGVVGDGILFWDWEAGALNKGVARLAKIREYLKSKIGYAAIYASGSVCKSNKSEIDKWDLVWVAAYGSDKTQNGYKPDATQTWYPDAKIHQYTQHGRLSGFGSDLDLNVAHMSASDWFSIAGKSNSKPSPKPDAKPDAKPESVDGGKETNYRVPVDYRDKDGKTVKVPKSYRASWESKGYIKNNHLTELGLRRIKSSSLQYRLIEDKA